MKVIVDIPENKFKDHDGSIDLYYMAGALANGMLIPDDATNGDILKAVFNIKDEQITERNLFISVSEFDCSKDNLCDPHDFFKTWWNAPYEKADKEEGR